MGNVEQCKSVIRSAIPHCGFTQPYFCVRPFLVLFSPTKSQFFSSLDIPTGLTLQIPPSSTFFVLTFFAARKLQQQKTIVSNG